MFYRSCQIAEHHYSQKSTKTKNNITLLKTYKNNNKVKDNFRLIPILASSAPDMVIHTVAL